MFEELSSKLKAIVDKIRGKAYIDEKVLNEILRDIQRALLTADVNVKIVFELTSAIKKRFKEERPPSGVSLKDYVIRLIYEEMVKVLGGEKAEIKINKKPFLIMLVGLEGSGKTTTAAKLAKYYADMNYKVGIFTTDVYRPAAREQLKQLVSNIQKVEYYEENIDDAVKIAKNGVDVLKKRGVDLIIIDTAGRHKKEETLLKEMEEMDKHIQPDLILLVIDATIGQKAYEQAKAFREHTRIGGIVITKLDGTARGGGALSAAAATGAKILFIGIGEKIDDLEEYDPYSFVGRLLGIGDLKTLLEKVNKAIEKEEMERIRKIAKGRFTLLDMMEQLEQVYKMGGLYKLLSFLPGLGGKISKEEVALMEKKIKMWKVAIDSMTLEEKINPKIIKKSRLVRISRGSGVDERTIREMVKQYEMMKKLMRSRRHKRLLKGYIDKLGV